MIWDFILYSIPWQVKLGAGLAVLAVVALLVGNIIGWDLMRPLLIPLAALVGVLAIWNKAQQDGYNQRKVQEKDAEDKAIKTVDDTRQGVNALPDDKLDGEVDKWTRP